PRRSPDLVGVTSYPGSPEEVVVLAETTDASGQVLETRSATVALARTGGDQGVVFAEPLPVEHRHTAVVEVQASDGTVLVEEVTAQEAFTGSGTEADPYVIHSWDQMQLIAEAPDAHYLLGSDLELKGIPRPQIGAEWVVQEESSGTTRGPGAFTGVFDGGGHLIIGFRADGDIGGGRYSLGAGLFDTNAGTIRNLGVAEALMHGELRIGGLLADTNAGTIERCWDSGQIDSHSRIGGLYGERPSVLR